MVMPEIEVWVLIFTFAVGEQPYPQLIGGEYQTRQRCEAAAIHQHPHWRLLYGDRLSHRCKLTRM